MKKKKIVILGAGFGGVNAYLSMIKKLSPDEADILIINKTNYFLFTPMLHEVATGGLGEHHVVEAVREIVYEHSTNVLVAEITKIDIQKNILSTTRGEIYFDYLVIALGATTHFFNTVGAEEHSLVLKDLSEAIRIRNKLIALFEEASHIHDERIRKNMLTFAVVGGGATGVELSAEMADLFFDTFKVYYKHTIRAEDVSLYLLSAGSELLPMFPHTLRKKALDVLRKKGVKVLLNTSVQKVTKDAVIFSNDRALPVGQVIWTAGVRPVSVEFGLEDAVSFDHSGRIIVDAYGRMMSNGKALRNVFALGDIAAFTQKDGSAHPMLAQVAVQQGKVVGANIARDMRGQTLKKFVYRSKGSLVSLGQWQAVGRVLGITWKGPLAWWVWRTVYLFNFSSWPKRIKIALDWTINIFYPRDITKP